MTGFVVMRWRLIRVCAILRTCKSSIRPGFLRHRFILCAIKCQRIRLVLYWPTLVRFVLLPARDINARY
jgi:hypothetical protein